jgi:alpha-ketoglutarate-dependent taurine dioxygenase
MDITLENYAIFGHFFGRPWQPHEYKATQELTVKIPGTALCVSEFSNKLITRIGDEEMLWHADIPNKIINPFPHRALWIDKNPNPLISGKTRWLNITLDFCKEFLSPEQLSLLDRVTVEQQSWHRPGTEIRQYPLIKTHSITGQKSLRLNAYCTPEASDLWIKRVFIDEVEQQDCSLIQGFISTLENVPELSYTHTWERKDIAIYDNWSFIHGRTPIILSDTLENERKFYRINIDHVRL